jgi:hypothetical protein
MSTKRLVIFASSKGGSGKSTSARAFVDLARRAGRTVAVYDLDGGTGSLAMLYKDRNPVVGAGTENARDPDAPAAWLNDVHGDADDVCLDVPGGALGDLVRVLAGGAQTLVNEAQEANRTLVLVSVIGVKRDATLAPIEAIRMFGNGAKHIALKNGLFAPADGFVVFDGLTVDGIQKYGKAKLAVEEAGGTTIFFPKLDHITDAVLDIEGLTFAAGGEAGKHIGRRAATNARYWLDLVATAFAGTWLDVTGAVPGVGAPSKNGKATRGSTEPINA